MSLLETARGLITAGSDLYGYNECCQPVVDPYTYLALISGVGLVTWFLQMTIVMTMFVPPRRKRDASINGDSWIGDIVNKVIEDDDEDETLSLNSVVTNNKECVSILWNCLSELTLNMFNGLHSAGRLLNIWELPLNVTQYKSSSVRKIEIAASCIIQHDRCQSEQ